MRASELSGSQWHRQEFLSTGSILVPVGVYRMLATGCAGGQGGGAGSYNGGAGGEGCIQYPISVTPGQSLSIQIGAGGSGAASGSGRRGARGGDTVVGALVLHGTPLITGTSSNEAQYVWPFVIGAKAAGNTQAYAAINTSPYYGAAGMFGPGAAYQAANATNTASAGANTGAGGGTSYGGKGGDGGSGRLILEWQA